MPPTPASSGVPAAPAPGSRHWSQWDNAVKSNTAGDRLKIVGGWPELAERELRQLLHEMRVDVKGVLKGDTGLLRALFDRTLAKVQKLPWSSRAEHSFDPSSLLRCELNLATATAFADTLVQEEVARMTARPEATYSDAYLQYRNSLSQMVFHYQDSAIATNALQNADNTAAMMLVFRGARQHPKGFPLIEVQWLCSTMDTFGPDHEMAVSFAMMAAGDNCHVCTVKMLEAMLIREILMANAARLSPEYTRRCKQAWGVAGTPYQVSFLVPATVLDAQQLEGLQARCGNSACKTLASLNCSRCQTAKYCSARCQRAHWPTHKAQCKPAASPAAPSKASSPSKATPPQASASSSQAPPVVFKSVPAGSPSWVTPERMTASWQRVHARLSEDALRNDALQASLRGRDPSEPPEAEKGEDPHAQCDRGKCGVYVIAARIASRRAGRITRGSASATTWMHLANMHQPPATTNALAPHAAGHSHSSAHAARLPNIAAESARERTGAQHSGDQSAQEGPSLTIPIQEGRLEAMGMGDLPEGVSRLLEQMTALAVPLTQGGGGARVQPLSSKGKGMPADLCGNERFLVKVQICLEMDASVSDGTRETPHLIYDQKRSFHCYVGKGQPAFDVLFDLVRQKGVSGGTKIYLWCKRASDSTLQLFLDGRPAKPPSW
ncbi:hypothetical protein WJX73_001431 [Symbiochloris irregularis]|uniref:MYND-type domain-containing protein n=1 Tax=Symbiochloris irregularis TaxID=706552 RepID=A0AAW1PVW6_9CHLO